MNLFLDLTPEILANLKDLNYFCGALRDYGEKEKIKELKHGDEIKSLTKEELQNMKFKLSIEIPKEDFDRLVKAMLKEGDTTLE